MLNKESLNLTLEDFLLEKEAMEFLGVNKQQMYQLRYKEELPFVRVNQRARLYFVPDLLNWLLKRKMESGKTMGQD